MIVCIAGVSSTGKTTLLTEIEKSKELLTSRSIEVEFKKEYIRDYVRDKYPDKTLNDLLSDPEDAITLQFVLTDYVHQLYVDMLKSPDTLYICDRSPLDALVYLTLNYSCASEDLLEKHAAQYSRYCSKLRLLSRYVERIYLTLPDMSTLLAEDDGFRPVTYNSRRNLEFELFNTIFEFNPRVMRLPSLPDLRLTAVLADLSDLVESKRYNGGVMVSTAY